MHVFLLQVRSCSLGYCCHAALSLGRPPSAPQRPGSSFHVSAIPPQPRPPFITCKGPRNSLSCTTKKLHSKRLRFGGLCTADTSLDALDHRRAFTAKACQPCQCGPWAEWEWMPTFPPDMVTRACNPHLGKVGTKGSGVQG